MVNPCLVVAEIGNNHNGDFRTAADLIAAAADAGAHAVKFQHRTVGEVWTREYLKRPYEHENSYGRTYGEHRRALELEMAVLRRLGDLAHDLGLLFGCTVFDPAGMDDVCNIDVDFVKIASGDLTNTPLIAGASTLDVPIVISTGGGTWGDVDAAWDAAHHAPSVTLLQCTAAYPAEAADLNLAVVPAMRERYPDAAVGVSLHHSGIAMALAAYMLGAEMIEMHFTLGHAMKGPDHAFSLEPQGLRRLCRDLVRARVAVGSADKRPLPVEAAAVRKMGKSCYAARALPVGHVLTLQDLAFRSPVDERGLPPSRAHLLVGRALGHSVLRDDLLHEDALAPQCGVSDRTPGFSVTVPRV